MTVGGIAVELAAKITASEKQGNNTRGAINYDLSRREISGAAALRGGFKIPGAAATSLPTRRDRASIPSFRGRLPLVSIPREPV